MGDQVIRINVATEEVEEIGPILSGKNKWQNGFLGRDGANYCIPCDASTVLRIEPLNPNGEIISTFGDLGNAKEKWEGGVVGPDGCLYCVPQESEQVLRIE